MTNNSNWIITSGTVNGYRAKQYAQLDNSGRPIKIDICIDINGDGINDFKIFRKDGSSSVFTAVARDGESYWEFANSQYDSFKSAPFIEAKKAPVPQPVAEEPQTVTTQTTSATPASVAQPQVQSEPQVVESQPKEEPQEEKKPKSINYTVKEGDSLSKIAGEHGISVAELRAANGIPPKSTLIRKGQILVIPVKQETASVAETKKADAPTQPASQTSDSGITYSNYTVVSGDNIDDIVKTINQQRRANIKTLDGAIDFVGKAITVEDVMKANGLKEDDYIYPDQVLKIPNKCTETFDEKERRRLTIAANYAKKPEGFHDGKPYICPAGKPTIGYGHVLTGADHSKLREAKSITQEQGQRLLENDMKKAYAQVRNILGKEVMDKLTDEQAAALTSYMFNVGNESFSANSKLAKKLKAGDYAGAQAEMDVVTSNNGTKLLPGLINRRAHEMLMFGGGTLNKTAQDRIYAALRKLYGYKTREAALAGLKKEKNMQDLYKLLSNPSSYYAGLSTEIAPQRIATNQ